MIRTRVNVSIQKVAEADIKAEHVNYFSLLAPKENGAPAASYDASLEELKRDIVGGAIYFIKTGEKVIGYVKLGKMKEMVGTDYENLTFMKPFIDKAFRGFGIMKTVVTSIVNQVSARKDDDNIVIVKTVSGNNFDGFISSLKTEATENKKAEPIFTVIESFNDPKTGKHYNYYSNVANKVILPEFKI